ncbi:DUF4189 domain-containing protein [Escherichia coli]|nr:DUF4189 domain-containing protein [Escherichia coli]
MDFKVKLALIITSLFYLFSSSVMADYIAYAGSENSWGWGVGSTQNEADKTALNNCNSVNEGKCSLDGTKAIVVVADDDGHTYFYKSATVTAKEAREQALKDCNGADCKVVTVAKTPGFYMLSGTRDEKGDYDNLFLQYGSLNRVDAIEKSILGCKKKGGDNCEVIWSGAISGDFEKGKTSGTTAKKNVQKSNDNCRPQTATLKCHSQCVNGSCIVTYENGCKIRVQVQPKFNGFSNSWEYPSPSC